MKVNGVMQLDNADDASSCFERSFKVQVELTCPSFQRSHDVEIIAREERHAQMADWLKCASCTASVIEVEELM